MWKGREICHFDLLKGLEGIADACCGDEKFEKTFWFEVYSCHKESAFTAVKGDAKF